MDSRGTIALKTYVVLAAGYSLKSGKLNIPINALVAEIDVDRGVDTGLASAIRLYVLKSLKARLP